MGTQGGVYVFDTALNRAVAANSTAELIFQDLARRQIAIDSIERQGGSIVTGGTTVSMDEPPALGVGFITGVYRPQPEDAWPSQRALAEALLASGQLTLGPESFSSPAAQVALAAALQGGRMSSPFNLAGIPPGGTTPFMPFGAPATPFLGGVFDSPSAALGTFGSVLGVGAQFFLQQQQQKAAEDAAKQQLRLLMAQQMLLQQQQLGFAGGGFGSLGQILAPVMGGVAGGLASAGADALFGMLANGAQGPSWVGQPGVTPAACCGTRGAVTVSPMDASAIYREGCGPCGSTQLITRNRFFALRSDGTRDLFVRVGKVQSVSPRVLNRFARRWAKEAKLTVGARGQARRRTKRRPR